MAAVAFVASSTLASAQTVGETIAADAPLAEFAGLAGGAWTGAGEGYRTELSYRWVLPGRVLEATNEVYSADGRVLAQYHGAYVWDRGRGQVVFWIAAASGEVHRGRAWWRDGVLWHEADVSGGSIDAYASAMRLRDGRLEYFAAYGRPTAEPGLLDTVPIVYTRTFEQR